MNVYNLLLNIILITLPFRRKEYMTQDYYFEYIKKEIQYDVFVQKIYNLIRDEINITNYDDFVIVLENIYPPKNIHIQNIIDLFNIYISNLNYLGEELLKYENLRIYINDIQYVKYYDDIFYPFTKDERIIAWHYLTQYMNNDTLIINYMLNKTSTPTSFLKENMYSGQPEVFNTYESRIFQDGIYENHLHFGGSIDFNMQWWYIIGKRNSNQVKLRRETRKLNEVSNSNFDYHYWILASIIVRYLLTKMITLNVENEFNDVEKKYFSFLKDYSEGKQTYNSIDLSNYIDEINMQIDINKSLFNQNREYEDYIGQFIKYHDKEINEVYFEFLCLKYIHEHLSNDSLINQLIYKCIFNYLRIKNSVFSLKVQHEEVRGLGLFSTFYKTNKTNLISMEDMLESILKNYDKQKYVKGIELKISSSNISNPDKIFLNCKKTTIRLLESYKKWITERKKGMVSPNDNDIGIQMDKNDFIQLQNEERANDHLEMQSIIRLVDKQDLIKLGFVILFKKENPNLEKICINDYFINKEIGNLCYASNQLNMAIEILVIQYMRNIINDLEWFIVGVDVAGNENDTEPWVYAPVYRCLKNIKSEIKNNTLFNEIDFFKEINFDSNKELGYTYHVGEVFTSVISGLRHIDEVIDYFDYTRGDRIGHALALSLDLNRYLNENRVLQIRKIDYLKNLLWMRHLLADEEVVLEQINVLQLEEKILKVFYSIFSSSDCSNKDVVNIDILMRWYKIQFEFINKQISYINGERCPMEEFCPKKNLRVTKGQEWTLDKLIASNHCQYYLNKMRESIRINENKTDMLIYKTLQDFVKKKVSHRGIIVELNPVSNTCIGEIGNVTLLPYLNLNSMGIDNVENSHIIGSINTDDSSVFNTNLVNQYAILGAELAYLGYSKDEIFDWLKRLRDYSENSTFLLSKKIASSEMVSLIDHVIEQLKNN